MQDSTQRSGLRDTAATSDCMCMTGARQYDDGSLPHVANGCLVAIISWWPPAGVGRVATVVGTTRRLNEQVRRRCLLALTERGASHRDHLHPQILAVSARAQARRERSSSPARL
jgi:hypothetical protein